MYVSFAGIRVTSWDTDGWLLCIMCLNTGERYLGITCEDTGDMYVCIMCWYMNVD